MFGSVYRPALLAFRAGIGKLAEPAPHDLLSTGLLIGTAISPWAALAVGAEAKSFLPICAAVTGAVGLVFRLSAGRTISRFLHTAAIAILVRWIATEVGRAVHRKTRVIELAAISIKQRAEAEFLHVAPSTRTAGAFSLGMLIGMLAIVAVGLGPRLQATATASTVVEQIDPTALTLRAGTLPVIAATGI